MRRFLPSFPQTNKNIILSNKYFQYRIFFPASSSTSDSPIFTTTNNNVNNYNNNTNFLLVTIPIMSSFQVNIHSKADLFSATFLGLKPKQSNNNNNRTSAAPADKKPSSSSTSGGAVASATTPAADDRDKLFLEEATHGKVQTRFPPEASGFLHIGHAKALLINRMLADKYEGKMLFRFDDTNPAKEKHEFELSIIEDMRLLGVKEDLGPSYSSQFFDKFQEYAEVLIKAGDAYCDSTEVDQMRKERMDGIESKFRNASPTENLRVWNEMLKGSAEGQKACLRAKIDMQADNKALRDPVLYRVNVEVPHARTGTKYKAYPTYDFCCPIIDSLEGVTHALRTNEYHDRNAQYFWINEKLGLRQPYIQDFSRLNMEYTLMSKRKLTKLVEDKVVDGWDDPRMPTVRGLLRKGMTVNALREFIKVQGMSKVVNLMEWSKIWAFNNIEIDPNAARYSAVDNDAKVTCTITNFAAGGGNSKPLTRARHMKNEKLGEKTYFQTPTIFLDGEDVALLTEGEEVTLMAWGNAFIKNIQKDDKTGRITACNLELNPTGDFKKTKYKLTWVPDLASAGAAIPQGVKPSLAVGKEFDHVLNKKKPEDGDDFDALINPFTLFTTNFLGEPSLAAEVKKGQFIQIERRGFYLVDDIDEKTGVVTLHAVPNGQDKINHLSAKAAWIKANPDLAAKLPSSIAANAGGAAAAASAKAKSGGAGEAGDAAKALEAKRAEKAAKKQAQKAASA